MMKPYLVGLLYGDGTSNFGNKNKAYAVWIDQHQRNSAMVDKAVEEFRSLGLNVHHYGYLNKMRALVYNKRLFMEFREIRKEPIHYFKKLSKKGKLEFISGFFDAEGTVTDRLVLYNGNTVLLAEIQRFLETLSIVGKIYRYGKIHGLQIYRRKSISIFASKTNSIKILKSVLPS